MEITPQGAALVTAIIGALVGALVGGGAVVIVYGRAIKLVLESPIIITSLEQLAKSWPAPVREAIHDTGKLITEVTDDTPAVPPPPAEPSFVAGVPG